jgi:integrase
MGTPPFSLKEKRDIAESEKQEKIDAIAAADERDSEMNITFGNLADDFLLWATNNKKSFKDDIGRYNNHIKKPLGDLPARSITAKHIDDLKTEMKIANLSDKTIHHTIGLIRAIYNKAAYWKTYTGQMPELKFDKFDNKRVEFLSFEEAAELLDKLKKVNDGTMYHQAVISLHAGLRFGEIAKLTWADVNFENRILTILDPKGIHTRTVHMTDSIHALLLELKSDESRMNDLCFPDQYGNRQKHVSNTFYRITNELFNKDVNDRRQKICFHSLRHTFCSWLAIQGVSLYEIQKLAGHSEIKMTARYAHLIPELQKKAIQSLEDSFKIEVKNIQKRRFSVVR